MATKGSVAAQGSGHIQQVPLYATPGDGSQPTTKLYNSDQSLDFMHHIVFTVERHVTLIKTQSIQLGGGQHIMCVLVYIFPLLWKKVRAVPTENM